jgi:hypothetical protein
VTLIVLRLRRGYCAVYLLYSYKSTNTDACSPALAARLLGPSSSSSDSSNDLSAQAWEHALRDLDLHPGAHFTCTLLLTKPLPPLTKPLPLCAQRLRPPPRCSLYLLYQYKSTNTDALSPAPSSRLQTRSALLLTKPLPPLTKPLPLLTKPLPLLTKPLPLPTRSARWNSRSASYLLAQF